MNYGRNAFGGGNIYMSTLNAEIFDINTLLELAYSSGSNYLILYNNKDVTSDVEDGRCRIVDEVGDYTIYYVEDICSMEKVNNQ